MLPFSLRQLEIFVAVARHENVSAAAQALNMSQSAASTALNEMERRSASLVFDRAGNRLILNETGRQLLPKAIELLDRAQDIGAILTGQAGGATLRVGMTATIGDYIAPALITHQRRENPQTLIHLEVGNTERITKRAANFDVDLALIEGECTNPLLDIIDWRADELILFVAPGHPLAGGRWPVSRLLEERWVVREPGSGTRLTLDRAMRGHEAAWKIDIELEHFEAIKRFVQLGDGIGCISRLALEDELRDGRLAEIHCDGLNLHRRLSLVIHKRKFRTAAIHIFCALIGVRL